MNENNAMKFCAIYTRKSVEEGLDMEFNSLDAQREAGEHYVASQSDNGWVLLPKRYDDGGYSGANTNRPALKELLKDCAAGLVNVVVVYKIDRLSRSIYDFAELSKKFDRWGVSFCSVTQDINTSTSSGRMVLNILMTFAQFEREIIGERIRDKVAATRRKGMWSGGNIPLGYRVKEHKLVPVEEQAAIVRRIFHECAVDGRQPKEIAEGLNNDGLLTKSNAPWQEQHITRILANCIYIGEISYRNERFKGEHLGIVSREDWCKAQNVIKSTLEKNGRRVHQEAPLEGLLSCGVCGKTMYHYLPDAKKPYQRYYRCQYVLATDGFSHHFAAKALEGTIWRSLLMALRDANVAIMYSAICGRDIVEWAETLASTQWSKINQKQRRELFCSLLAKVTIHPDRLELEIRTDGVKEMAGNEQTITPTRISPERLQVPSH